MTSVRGIGFAPTTSASVALGVTGLMKAAFGFRVLVFFFAMQSPLKDAQKRRPESTTKPALLRGQPIRIRAIIDDISEAVRGGPSTMYRWVRILTAAALAGVSAGAGPRSLRPTQRARIDRRSDSPRSRSGGAEWMGTTGAQYDGRFTFVRLRWDSGSGGRWRARATPGTTTTPAPNRTS